MESQVVRRSTRRVGSGRMGQFLHKLPWQSMWGLCKIMYKGVKAGMARTPHAWVQTLACARTQFTNRTTKAKSPPNCGARTKMRRVAVENRPPEAPFPNLGKRCPRGPQK